MRTTSRVLDAAAWIDRRARGWRVKVLVVSAFLSALASSAAGPKTTATGFLSSAWFVLVLLIFFMARVGSFRDDNDRWSWALVEASVGEALQLSQDGVTSFLGAPPRHRLQAAGKGLAAIGLLTIATSNVLLLATRGFSWLTWTGFLILCLGVVTWISGWWFTHQAGRRAGLLVSPEHIREVVFDALGALPPIINCHDEAGVRGIVQGLRHPLLCALVVALADWRPRRASTEKQYQLSLYRHLKRRMPDAEPEREVEIPSPGYRRLRPDLRVGECVLIEMKRELSTSTAQKALGQVIAYLQSWKDRGPLILVLCDTDATHVKAYLETAIIDLRHRGHPIVAVLAGPR